LLDGQTDCFAGDLDLNQRGNTQELRGAEGQNELVRGFLGEKQDVPTLDNHLQAGECARILYLHGGFWTQFECTAIAQEELGALGRIRADSASLVDRDARLALHSCPIGFTRPLQLGFSGIQVQFQIGGDPLFCRNGSRLAGSRDEHQRSQK
jgi:hypothetical protein